MPPLALTPSRSPTVRPSARRRAPTRPRWGEIRWRSSRNRRLRPRRPGTRRPVVCSPARRSSAADSTITFKIGVGGIASKTAAISACTASKSPSSADADVDHHVDLVGACRDRAARASSALIAERCLPDGNPTTDGDVHTRPCRNDLADGNHRSATRTPRTPRVRRPLATSAIDVGLGRLRLEQRVVDERGHARRGCSAALERFFGAAGVAARRDHLARRRPRVATARGSSWSCRARRVRRMPVAQELGAACRACRRRATASAPRPTPRRPAHRCRADRDACRAASVGYTRRLDRSPHFAHCDVVDVRRAGHRRRPTRREPSGQGHALHGRRRGGEDEAHAASGTFPGSPGSSAGRRRDRRLRPRPRSPTPVMPSTRASSTPPPRITSQTGLVSLSAAV